MICFEGLTILMAMVELTRPRWSRNSCSHKLREFISPSHTYSHVLQHIPESILRVPTDSSQTRHENDKQQFTPIFRSGLQIGRPISWINVRNGSDESGA